MIVATLRDLMGAMDPEQALVSADVMGAMDTEQALVSADVMGAELRRVLSWTTGTWGVRVNRAEISAMAPPGRY